MNYDLRFTMCALLAAGTLAAQAGDLSPGYTFSDIETDPNSLVTSNALDLLVSAATLKTNAITDRTAVTATATNDLVLLYAASAGGLRRAALSALLPTNSVKSWQFASNAVVDWTLASNTLQNLHLRTNWLDAVPPNTNTTVNQPAGGAGTNLFVLTGRSVLVGSNGLPTNTSLSLTPWGSLLTSTSFTATVQAVATGVVTNMVSTNRFVTNGLSVQFNRVTVPHGLGVVPAWVRAVFVCVTNTGVFLVGDEVDVNGIYNTGVYPISVTANATNLVVAQYYYPGQGGTTSLITTNSTAYHVLDTSNWRLKLYAAP